jgi:hypothetical protein
VLLLVTFLGGRVRNYALSLSGIEAGVGTGQNYNRGFSYFGDLSGFFSAEFNGNLSLNCAAALGQRGEFFGFTAAARLAYGLPFFRPFVPLYFRSQYLYDGFPAWETSTHSLIPSAALEWKWFGLSLGYTLRWTVFAGEAALFEPVLAYRVYGKLYAAEDSSISLRISNFGDFYADNLGSVHLGLDNRFRIASGIQVKCDFELILSGNVKRIVSVYGVSFTEGIIFRW